jgi:hypothetical protein
MWVASCTRVVQHLGGCGGGCLDYRRASSIGTGIVACFLYMWLQMQLLAGLEGQCNASMQSFLYLMCQGTLKASGKPTVGS